MRLLLFLLVAALAWPQTPDPAYQARDKAYLALKDKRYEEAIAAFLKSIELEPDRAPVRKDLAYAYLKIGQPEAAREQFAEAMRLDPRDLHVALEYAFLCNDTKQVARARRVFDRLRRSDDPRIRATAEQAFQNIDGPLAAGIGRWKMALELAPESFTAHFELAELAEQRDQTELAAEHYRQSWRLLPERKSLLIDLARVYTALNRMPEARAAYLAASRSGEPRTAEAARPNLGASAPTVEEYHAALQLDPNNVELRRELSFLLVSLNKNSEAIGELAHVTKAPSPPASPQQVDSKTMAARSLKAGYMKDALKYLQAAYEDNPEDPWVQIKLGWTHNMLHDDREALRWFDLARHSSDAKIAAEAARAYENLRPDFALSRTTVWLNPFFSTRWHDAFGYGQIKTDLKIGRLPIRPYLSTRFAGDTRQTTGGPMPQYLSESAAIVGAGLATSYWHGLMAWAEAGEAMSYLKKAPGTGRMTPDYRGGVSYAKGFGHFIGQASPGFFFETANDGLFISRYDHDVLIYSQNKIGYTLPVIKPLGELETQLLWNGDFIGDIRTLDWANYVETGPGLRFRWKAMPRSLVFSVSLLRGAYTVKQTTRGPNFTDLRAGFWYAATH